MQYLSKYTQIRSTTLQTQSDWTQLSAGQNFTQEDVEMNRLWYEHVAAASRVKGHDSFRFSLSDLDNETPTQSFFISIHTTQKGQRSQLTGDDVIITWCQCFKIQKSLFQHLFISCWNSDVHDLHSGFSFK